jgi:hypothetical protein
MCNLPNMTKYDLAELSQRRKKKLEKTSFKKTDVKVEELAFLEGHMSIVQPIL